MHRNPPHCRRAKQTWGFPLGDGLVGRRQSGVSLHRDGLGLCLAAPGSLRGEAADAEGGWGTGGRV